MSEMSKKARKLTLIRAPYDFLDNDGNQVVGVSTKMRYYYGEAETHYFDVKVPREHISILNFLYPEAMSSDAKGEYTLIG